MTKKDLKSSCVSANELQNYLKIKGENHNCYKAYGEMANVIKMRDEQSLILSTGEKWNDITDRNNFNNETYKCINFGKCFSYSQDERVAMWMLYGGLRKSGGMVDFIKKGIKNILDVRSIEVGYFENEKFKRELVLNRDYFDIYVTDVVYYKENANGFYIKRSDETSENVSKNVINELSVGKKVYPWSYENECRLVASVDKSLVTDKCQIVKIDLSGLDLGKSLERIYKSPNYSGENYPNIQKSKLSETIDWDLCDKCAYCVAMKE